MKLPRILAAAVLTVCISTAAAFAAPEVSSAPNTNSVQQTGDKHGWDKQQDPLKMLQSKKEKVQSLLKEGKITKEEADTITAKIDARIKEVQQFNSLSPQQKKDKLKSDFKTRLDQKVKDGKLAQDKADEILKKFNEKIEKWDGTGYPPFHGKGCKMKEHPGADNKKQ